jgi:hypothetical protein
MPGEVGASVGAGFDFVMPEGFVIAPSSALTADDARMRQAFGHGLGLAPQASLQSEARRPAEASEHPYSLFEQIAHSRGHESALSRGDHESIFRLRQY